MFYMNDSSFRVARGEKNADLVISNASIIDVFNNTIYKSNIAIYDGIIVGIGDYKGREVIDVEGAYVMPGLIDSHLHIESSMMTPKRFGDTVINHGITTIIADPHEIANVCGVSGVKYMIEDSKNTQCDIKMMLPSCVPATAFETAGAELNAKVIEELITNEEIFGLGEMMNYPAVINGFGSVTAKLISTLRAGKVIDGHCPNVRGNDLNVYILSGIKTDHECSEIEEAKEKISKGMYIQVREGGVCKDLKALIPLAKTPAYRRMVFCSDDCHPDFLINGTINNSIKLAVSEGVDFVTAVTMATLNASECYNLNDRGAIAIGRIADLVIIDDIESFNIQRVYKAGKLVSYRGVLINEIAENETSSKPLNNFVCERISEKDFGISITTDKARLIEIYPNGIVTGNTVIDTREIDESINKLCVYNRYSNSGDKGLGLVKGYGIKGGAVAMSIAHDSHNIIAISDNDADLACAINEIVNIKGGITVCSGGKVLETLPLEVGGLMTDKSVEFINERYEKITEIARSLGVEESIHPLLSLSFLALPVIPHLKLTDKGLFDVDKFEFTSTEVV